MDKCIINIEVAEEQFGKNITYSSKTSQLTKTLTDEDIKKINSEKKKRLRIMSNKYYDSNNIDFKSSKTRFNIDMIGLYGLNQLS